MVGLIYRLRSEWWGVGLIMTFLISFTIFIVNSYEKQSISVFIKIIALILSFNLVYSMATTLLYP